MPQSSNREPVKAYYHPMKRFQTDRPDSILRQEADDKSSLAQITVMSGLMTGMDTGRD